MLLDKKIPVKYIFDKIRFDMVIILGIGIIAHYLATRYQRDLPLMPPYIPALLGTAISILLSFKMNQSYDRWWEARKVWGSIVNDSRTLVIQLQSFVTADRPEPRAIAFRQIAFCYSLGRSLRGLDATEHLDQYISNEEIVSVSRNKNVPLALLQVTAGNIRQLKEASTLDVFCQVQLDDTIQRLVDSMGRAERIKATVFPSTYRLFLHFTIYIFAITLSIALNHIDMLFELPLLLVIASCFFLIEKSAQHLQDPFSNRPSDVPVTAISRTIEINLRQLIGETDIPGPVEPNDFYIM